MELVNKHINLLFSHLYRISQQKIIYQNIAFPPESKRMPQLQRRLMQLQQNYNRSKQALYVKELTLICKKKIVKLDEANSKSVCKICQYCQSIMHQYYCKVQTQSYSSRVKLCVKCTYLLLTQPACNCQISSTLAYFYQDPQQISNTSQKSMGCIDLKDFTLQFSEIPQIESQAQSFTDHQDSYPQSQTTNKCLKQFANTLANQSAMQQCQSLQSLRQPQPHHEITSQNSNDLIVSRLYRLQEKKLRMQEPIFKLKVVITVYELIYENLTPKHEFEAKMMTFFCQRVLSRAISATYSPTDIIAKKEIMLIYNCWIEKVKQYLKDERNTILKECPSRDLAFFRKFTSTDPRLSAINEDNKKSWYFHGLTKNAQNWNRLISRLKNGEYDFSCLPHASEPSKSIIPRVRLPK